MEPFHVDNSMFKSQDYKFYDQKIEHKVTVPQLKEGLNDVKEYIKENPIPFSLVALHGIFKLKLSPSSIKVLLENPSISKLINKGISKIPVEELVKFMPPSTEFMKNSIRMAKNTLGILGKGVKQCKIVKESVKNFAINKFPGLNKKGFFSTKNFLKLVDLVGSSVMIGNENSKYIQLDEFDKKLYEVIEEHQHESEDMDNLLNKQFPELGKNIKTEYDKSKMEIENKYTGEEKDVMLQNLKESFDVATFGFLEIYNKLHYRLENKLEMQKNLNEKLPNVSDNPSLQRFTNVMSPFMAACAMYLISKNPISKLINPIMSKMFKEQSVKILKNVAETTGFITSTVLLKYATSQTVRKKEINEVVSHLEMKVDKNAPKEMNYDAMMNLLEIGMEEAISFASERPELQVLGLLMKGAAEDKFDQRATEEDIEKISIISKKITEDDKITTNTAQNYIDNTYKSVEKIVSHKFDY